MNISNTEEKLSKIEETEGSWKIKEGSYYYLTDGSDESHGMDDDFFKNFVFPYSVIKHSKCSCETVNCQKEVSGIYLKFGVVVTDRENLMRVS